MSCPSTNSNITDTSEDVFWSPDGIHWDAHRIGWAVAGGCAALTTLITLFTMTMHAIRYQHPPAQRQVLRVLMMPPVYAIVSFFSYRYYREYEYYILAETAYEAVTLSAFLMLLMELVSMNTTDQQIKSALKEKDKKKFPFPFGFWRFRASKPYFWHALSFSVMQYVVLRPLISIIGIITEYYGLLCPSEYSIHYASVYLEAVDFISISIALYGLIVFYVLCKDELKGRKPLNKFLAIKLIVFFTFYQSFVFSVLQSHNVIKGTALWTATNVSDGLSALCTCVEMVFFSIYMGWAYNWTDYTDPVKNPYQRKTSVKTYFQAIWDTINLSDFAVELYLACKFLVDYVRGRPGTHSQPTKLQKTFMPEVVDDKPQELSNLKFANSTPINAPSRTNEDGIMDSSAAQPPNPVRTPSGNLYSSALRSPDSYQRLREASADPEHQPEHQVHDPYGARQAPPHMMSRDEGAYRTNVIASPVKSGTTSYHTASQVSPAYTTQLSPSSHLSAATSVDEFATPRGEQRFPSPHPTGTGSASLGDTTPITEGSGSTWTDPRTQREEWPHATPYGSQAQGQYREMAQSPYGVYGEGQRRHLDRQNSAGGIPGNPRLF